MKKILTLSAFLVFTFAVYGQNTAQDYSRQFGFDAAALLGRLFNTPTSETPYYFTYRTYGENKNTRLGLGADFSVEGDGNGGTNSHIGLNFRVGSERFNDFGTRWRAFYGWDFKTFFSYDSNSGGGNSSTRLGLGVSPLFGLQWRLNERLSFSTELAYNLFLTMRDNNSRTRFGVNTSFSPPLALYAQYDF